MLCGALCGALGGALGAAVAATPAPQAPGCAEWADWAAFKRRFIGDAGRVAESATPRAQTVSEAQGYAMFFALVNNERELFERLLRWTEDNLAGGDLTARLPAWWWGRRDDGSFGVIDANPASDADLWIAYALGEAGRLWQERRYVALASLVADRLLREESADLPGLGLTLLPGPKGFVLGPGRWRLNPSYVPLPLMRWFAARSQAEAWNALLQSSIRLLRDAAPKGLAPEWALYQAGADDKGAFALAEMSAEDRAELLKQYAPMADLVERNGTPPEAVDALSGDVRGSGGPGFSAALLPFLAAAGRTRATEQQLLRLQARPPGEQAYYDQALALFGLGWHEGRYRFAADGSLEPAWKTCAALLQPRSRALRRKTGPASKNCCAARAFGNRWTGPTLRAKCC
jgi:endoglucanase